MKQRFSIAVLISVLAATLLATAGTVCADYGWAENAGWVNTEPTGSGIQVYPNGASGYLAGYAWGENVGWIKLGDGTGPYANNSASDWGVNMNASGALSGYAWGENIGWINFAPGGRSVTCDVATASLIGYAWAENIGWIHFTGPSPYMVVNADTWKYNATGALPATNWFAQTFPDGSWPSGQAPLGFGTLNFDDPSLPIATTLDSGWVTYYFRKSFVVSSPTSVTGLLASFIADDGAIIYLNGTKIHTTTNMPYPSDNSTSASPFVTEPYVPIQFTINTNLLATGTNVIAVEVHQAGAASSDLYWDLSLTKVAYATTNQLGGGEPVTPPDYTDPSASWVAYNDLAWEIDQISNRITRLTWVDDDNHDRSGLLVKYADGSPSPVTATFAGLAATCGQLWYTTNVGAPIAGSPADLLFNGKVDMNRTVYVPTTSNGTITLSGMDPARKYRVVIFGNRNAIPDGDNYSTRSTVVTLSGADAFSNTSTDGAIITGSANETTEIGVGTNNTGQIFRYTDIEVGTDGQISFNAVGGAANGYTWYLNSMMVELLSSGFTDTDLDGMDDAWEQSNFGGLTQSPTGDWDSDGSDNYSEYRAGTDPQSASSKLEFTSVLPTNAASQVVLRWSSVDGKSYTVQQGTNLATPFGTLASGIGATAPANTYTASATTAKGYLKIKVE